MGRQYKVLAKSAMKTPDIDAKHKIGCDGIEIQLLGELKGQKEHEWKIATDVFNINEFIGKGIEVVHAPIFKKHDALIEHMADFEDVQLLISVFTIAQKIAEAENKNIYVIFHSETTFDILDDLSNNFNRIANMLESLLLMFPRTILCIENVTPFRNLSSTGVRLCNNYHLDCVELVKKLREKLNTTRIGLVLDTCHQAITEKYMTAIYREAEMDSPDYSLTAYVKAYAPYINIMHVADFAGNGYGKHMHGIGFTEETKQKLFDILKIHDELVPDCIVTLEVEEDDYLVNANYSKTKALLDEYYNTNS